MGLLNLDDSAVARLLESMRGTNPNGLNAPPSNGGGPTPPPAPAPPPPQGDRGQMQMDAANAPPPPAPPQQGPLLGPPPMPPQDGPPVMQQPAPPPQVPQGGPVTKKGKSIMDRLFGSAEVPEEYKPLLSPSEQRDLKPGLISTLTNGIIGGLGRPEVMRNRAELALQRHDLMSTRQTAAEQAKATREIREKFAPIFASAKTPEDTYKAFGLMTAEMARNGLPLTEHMGTILKALEPNSKQYEPQLFVGPNDQKVWISPGATVPPGFTKYAPPKSDSAGGIWAKLPDGTLKHFGPDETPPKGSVDLSTNRTIITTAASNERAANSLTAQRAKSFLAAIKPQTDRAPIIEQALVTLKDAADTKDPEKQRTLYASAIANFVQAADQKAQLRWQLLNFFKSNVDPSIGGKWDVLKERLLSGTLPQYTTRAMVSHLENLKKMTADEISRQRQSWVNRHPSLDGELPDASDYFASGVGGQKYTSHADLSDAQVAEALRLGHTTEASMLNYWNNKK